MVDVVDLLLAATGPTVVVWFGEHAFNHVTLNQSTGISKADGLKDIVQLLASSSETARRRPEGSGRQNGFREIARFQKRVAGLAIRAF